MLVPAKETIGKTHVLQALGNVKVIPPSEPLPCGAEPLPYGAKLQLYRG